MTDTTFRKINSLNGKKKVLLNEFKFKSIKEAKKDYDFTGSDLAMYEILKEQYNEIIEQLQIDKRKLLSQKHNEYKRKSNEFLHSYNLPNNAVVRRILPSKGDIKHFKRAAFEQKFVNPDTVNGYESLNILNSTIPRLFQGLNETKGMKVNFTFGIIFTKKRPNEHYEREWIEYPYTTSPQIITNRG